MLWDQGWELWEVHCLGVFILEVPWLIETEGKLDGKEGGRREREWEAF